MSNYTDSTDLAPLTDEQLGQCIREHRFKYFDIEAHRLPLILLGQVQIHSSSLPGNAHVYRTWTDKITNKIYVVFAHPSFEPETSFLSSNGAVPLLNPMTISINPAFANAFVNIYREDGTAKFLEAGGDELRANFAKYFAAEQEQK